MKNIFIGTLVSFLLSPFTLMCMERQELIPLPEELLDLIKDHANVPTKTFSQTESLYPAETQRSQMFRSDRLIPTSFDPNKPTVGKRHHWKSWTTLIGHIGAPNNIEIGVEVSLSLFNSSSKPLVKYAIEHKKDWKWPSTGIRNPSRHNGVMDSLTPVDINTAGDGSFAYSYPETNTHGLVFIKSDYGEDEATLKTDYCISANETHVKPYRGEFAQPLYKPYKPMLQNQRGEVTALAMYPKNEKDPLPRVVYLKNVKVPVPGLFWQSEEMRQRMVVAERNVDGSLEVKLDILTPVELKKIIPFDIYGIRSYFALSNKGKLWKTREENGEVRHDKQIVRDRTGQKKRYQNFTVNNEEELIITLNDKGDVFVGDTVLRLLMRLTTIPNPQEVINVSHTHDATGNRIYIVYGKSFFGDDYGVTTIKYNYNSLILDYVNKGILTKRTQLKRPGLMLLKKLGL